MKKTFFNKAVMTADLTLLIIMSIAQGIIWGPHDYLHNKKVKEKAAANVKIYKEMHREQYDLQ